MMLLLPMGHDLVAECNLPPVYLLVAFLLDIFETYIQYW
jgi:hypothetical protein